MKQQQCIICGFIYEEAKGRPVAGIPAGTLWKDIPDDWICPECGAARADFEMIAPEEDSLGKTAEPYSRQVIIVGSGLAGVTVAREFRKLDRDTPLLLISADDGRFYSKPMLSNALAQGKDAVSLATATATQLAEQLNATFITDTRVYAIDPAACAVHSHAGALPYAKLVLALGASPIRLPLEGDGAGDVLSINNLMDYGVFRSAIADKRRVAILGAGLIGCEFANDLLDASFTVAIIDPAPWPLGRFMPKPAAQTLYTGLAERGVEWRLGTAAETINRSEHGYRITLADGAYLQADVVLSAVGLRPNTLLALEAGLRVERGIAVDKFLRTSHSDIYALGDCAEVEGLVLPFVMPIMHAARALAKTLAGNLTPLSYPAMPVVVKTPTHPVVIAPPAVDAVGEWHWEPVGIGVRALFRDPDGRLLGYALTGDACKEKQALTKELPPVLA